MGADSLRQRHTSPGHTFIAASLDCHETAAHPRSHANFSGTAIR